MKKVWPLQVQKMMNKSETFISAKDDEQKSDHYKFKRRWTKVRHLQAQKMINKSQTFTSAKYDEQNQNFTSAKDEGQESNLYKCK